MKHLKPLLLGVFTSSGILMVGFGLFDWEYWALVFVAAINLLFGYLDK